MRGADWIGNRRTIRDSVRGFGLPSSIGSVADVCRAGRLLVFRGFCVVVVDRWFGAGWCGLDLTGYQYTISDLVRGHGPSDNRCLG